MEPVRLLIAIALSMLSVMVTMSSRPDLNIAKMYSSSNVSIKRMGYIKRMGSVSKNVILSQHLRQLKNV